VSQPRWREPYEKKNHPIAFLPIINSHIEIKSAGRKLRWGVCGLGGGCEGVSQGIWDHGQGLRPLQGGAKDFPKSKPLLGEGGQWAQDSLLNPIERGSDLSFKGALKAVRKKRWGNPRPKVLITHGGRGRLTRPAKDEMEGRKALVGKKMRGRCKDEAISCLKGGGQRQN